jgi:hypothetical protein
MPPAGGTGMTWGANSARSIKQPFIVEEHRQPAWWHRTRQALSSLQQSRPAWARMRSPAAGPFEIRLQPGFHASRVLIWRR